MNLATSITALPAVGPARAAALERVGITTVSELLNWVPRRYLDLTNPQPIRDCRIGEFAVVAAEVASVSSRRSQRGQVIVTALLRDDSGALPAVWFNQPYRTEMLKVGQRAIFAGSVRREWKTGARSLSSPLTETQPRIIPLYSVTKGVTSRLLLQLVKGVLEHIELTEDLPDHVLAAADVVDKPTTYRYLHLPKSMDQVRSGHRRLAFEQLYALQCELAATRLQRRRQPTISVAADVALLKKFVKTLPFTLTETQRQAIWTMAREMEQAASPMYRLLNGDVGSGKTVVTAALALLTVQSGWRVLYMAPTELLAAQHAVTLRTLLAPFKVSVGLVTAQVKDDAHPVVVGTHALLSPVKHKRVGLIIIDEQHRFGVQQREQLVTKSQHPDGTVPHVVSLTATPIPRSLALAFFGDLDVTVLKALPEGRRPITTQVLSGGEVGLAYEGIRQAVARGEQAYVVCPLIEEVSGDGLVFDERHSVRTVWQELSETVFPDLRVGLLHGRLKPSEKERVIDDFNQGRCDILVSTSVVEVGVDVPNATVMVIEGAERFGIAQLHQLRGRVGRSTMQSYCWLVVRSDEPTARKRCEQVASTTDGFALARFDLAQRGPGDLIGLAQKGLNPIFLQDIDTALLQQAHDLARAEVERTTA